MMLEECLIDGRYAVRVAGTCAEALELMRAAPEDVRAAVLDVGLPDGRGDELGDRLRDLAPGLPIVLCTGFGMGEIRSRAFQQGRIVMISKPFQPEALLEALRAAEDQPPCLEGHGPD